MSPLTFFSRVFRSQEARFSCGVLIAVVVGGIGCKGDFAHEASSIVNNCPGISGTPWIPNVAEISNSNHDSSSSTSESTVTRSGPLTGLGQDPAGKTVEVTFTIPEDLGPAGSVTLTAEVADFPSALTGNAYALLVYLSDGTNEFVNLNSGCPSFFQCDASGNCTSNSSCTVDWPSAFSDRSRWEQRQFPVFGYTSVNTFPTCNWIGGDTTVASDPACAFNTHFFDGTGRLRTGTYTARYVLLADRYKSVTGYEANLKLTVTRKKDPGGTGGAVDLNIVLVGTSNIQAARTDQGKRNLDTLLSMVHGYLNQVNVGVKLGEVQVFEWGCEADGDAYANVDVNALGTMFATGSTNLAGSGPRALNVFLVDGITWSGDGTILGVSGGIGGPIRSGLPTSGLAFTSFGQLGSYNPTCTSSPCSTATMEHDFVETALTISHEIGHFLGLNHPSESGASEHDVIADTPICTTVDTSATAKNRITISSCLLDSNTLQGKKCSDVCLGYNKDLGSFCPEALECQFNHMMWWSSKNFKNGLGDGNAFSVQSGGIINYSPFVQ